MTASPVMDSKIKENLLARAKQVRRDIIEMTYLAASGHPGGSLSAVELLTALFFQFMKLDPKNPNSPDRDRIIVSKGHASPLLYSLMAQTGFFDPKLLTTFRQLGSPLQGHPIRGTLPGIEASTGSLGQGLSIAIGHALARKLDKKNYFTYVLMSDGELDEGQTWEAAAMAAHHKVDHLIVLLDANKFQLDNSTENICDMKPIPDKWRSFRWHVQEIDGHNFDEIIPAIQKAQQVKDQPCLILANTIKGKGISFMENNNHYHGVAPTKDERDRAMNELK